ncbi:MAG: GNAT family N-acetyltransferase [Xanthomonadaceae bacterium]|nr:GNAT family N-acetyltransferase [Xanthomonadaceae bacterium]
MTSALSIRPARVADAPLVCAAERETARVPGHLVSLPEEFSEEAFARKIAELAEMGSYLVAECNGAVVGHALLDFAGPQSALAHVRTLTIVVHPPNTRQGIGSALMNALLDWARGHPQVERVELRVRATNAAAIHLYEKCGFAEESRFRRRLKLPDGSWLDDIGMTWFASEQRP